MKLHVRMHPSKFRLGGRGERPIQIILPYDVREQFLDMPGTLAAAGGSLMATWDAAWTVLSILGQQDKMPRPPLERLVSSDFLDEERRRLPGLASTLQSPGWQNARGYQREGAFFLAARAYACEEDEMRLGKTFTAQLATKLVGGRWVVVAPASVKYVWAGEHARWFGQPTLVLEGLAADRAKVFCPACAAASHPSAGQVTGGCALDTYRLPKPARPNAVKLRYLHKVPAERIPELLRELPLSVLNYDLVSPRTRRDRRGAEHVDEKFMGWVGAVRNAGMTGIVTDEGHRFRGWTPNSRGLTRRERLDTMAEDMTYAYNVTGTPILGAVKNLWAQHDLISRGALTDARAPRRLPFSWDVRYCDGRKTDRGWYRDGCSAAVATELKFRRMFFTISRSKADVWDQVPRRQRSVIKLDPPDGAAARAMRFVPGSGSGGLYRAIKATAKFKLDTVAESILEECLSSDTGVKVALFGFNRDTVYAARDKMAKLVAPKTEGSRGGEYARLAAATSFRVWMVLGQEVTNEAKDAMCRAFREHTGSGVFIATLDAVPEGVSLRGASSVHFLDLHWNPMHLLQAEERPLEYGVDSVNIIYYLVMDTVDEYVYDVVVPKIEHIIAASADAKEAERMQRQMGQTDDRHMDDVISLMAAQANLAGSAFDED